MGGGAILPEPEKCFYIFDEAHHLLAGCSSANLFFSEFSILREIMARSWEGLEGRFFYNLGDMIL